MKISVGSTNPVKVEAVKTVVKKIWPNAEVISLEVNHGMSDQPHGEEQGVHGATKRAQLSLKETNADIGIGIEAYVEQKPYGMILSGCIVAINKEGKKGMGGSGFILLPEKIAKELRKGKELGPIMDDLVKDKDTKKKYGTSGILTKHMIQRQETFEKGAIYALAPFYNEAWYE